VLFGDLQGIAKSLYYYVFKRAENALISGIFHPLPLIHNILFWNNSLGEYI
jgi:hypothetical protein